MQYSITERNLVGTMHEKPENYDLLSNVMIHLGEPDGENYDGVLQLLDVIFSDSASLQEKRTIMEDAFQIPMTMNANEQHPACAICTSIWGNRAGKEQRMDRLECYEKMHADLKRELAETDAKLAELRAQGKAKTATYQTLFARRFTLRAWMETYAHYGIQ